ncbi:DNA polymerase [Aneurinibacillus aneurinilyticus]|uniref:DNA polymerase n=1 Tax=Aneurinibacillus aneurinilyticus TaxID=1391 RepID=UPI0036713102
MDVKLTLNLRTDTQEEAAKERVKKATKAKKAATESLEDAWKRIFAMKLSDTDRQRITEVKQAMESGVIGRRSSDASKRFSKAEALRLYAELSELQKERKLREMVENTPDNYRLITTEEQFAQLLADLANEPIIAVDTETTGVDVYSDVIVGISLTLPKADYHVYIPVAHEVGEQLARDYVLERLRPVLTDENVGKVLHNAIYDIHMFLRHDIRLAGLRWDTQTAMALLNENEPSFALKNLATKYLNEPSDTFATLFGKDAKFAKIPLDIALVYAAKDTDLTWRLYQFERKHLEKMPTVLQYYETIEVPLLDAIVDMERTGFDIDVEYAKQYGEEMKREIDEKERYLTEQLGGININSPAQLKPALERLTKRKLESTDAKKVLKPLASEFPVIATLLEYKEMAKLYSTYISVLPELIHPNTGKLHGRFNPMGARTGRFSSGGTGVNLQNQPKSARKLFVAPEGWLIMGGDWSQQEVRCAAYLTQEPTLIESYEKGRDVYASMASEVYGKPYEECGDGTPERKAMKVGVLASLYGTGKNTLAQQLGTTPDEAQAFLDEFFRKLPKVKQWIDETKAFAQKHGFVWMDKQQRKRRLPEAKKRIKPNDWQSRGEVMRALRQGPNAVVQGTSAIQTKATLVKLHELCKRKGWRLWATVHDEALLLVPDTITREDIAEFEDVMVNSYRFGNVPNKTDIELMKRWGEGMTVDEWFNEN